MYRLASMSIRDVVSFEGLDDSNTDVRESFALPVVFFSVVVVVGLKLSELLLLIRR
jgi:hypothetical protein